MTDDRGQQPAGLEVIEETLSWLSRPVEEILEISELDLNLIFPVPTVQGCRIVDARIRIEPIRPAV